MNPRFGLLCGWVDIVIMQLNSSVVLHGLLNNVRILFNRCIGCLTLINTLNWPRFVEYHDFCIEVMIMGIGNGLLVLNWMI